MAKLPWIDFLNVHRGAHLVCGVRSEEEQDLRPVAAKLGALIERQRLPGDYAVGVLRNVGEPRVACLFADGAAAARFATLVGARPSDPVEGWTRPLQFTLDADCLAAIDQAAGTRRRRRRAEG